MAKDYEYGFKALIKAVSESNERMDSQGFARMNKDILRKYFGPGAPGHGHVIATSACISGVLASLYSMNDEIAKKVEKLKTSQSGLRPRRHLAIFTTAPVWTGLKRHYRKAPSELLRIKNNRGNRQQLLKKRFTQQQKGVPNEQQHRLRMMKSWKPKKEAAKNLRLKRAKKRR